MEIVSHPSELRKVAEVGVKRVENKSVFLSRTNKGQGARLIISDVLNPHRCFVKIPAFSLKQCQLFLRGLCMTTCKPVGKTEMRSKGKYSLRVLHLFCAAV